MLLRETVALREWRHQHIGVAFDQYFPEDCEILHASLHIIVLIQLLNVCPNPQYDYLRGILNQQIGLEESNIRNVNPHMVVIEYAFVNNVGLFKTLDCMLSWYVTLECQGCRRFIVYVVAASRRTTHVILLIFRHRDLPLGLRLI